MVNRKAISESSYLKASKISKHFNYFFDESFAQKEKVFVDIKNVLEDSYKKYIKFFNFKNNPIIPVYIYPKLSWLHKECYGKRMPNWCIAGGGAGAVVTIDPSLGSKDRSYKSMINVLSHELAHEFASIYSDTTQNFFPEWFNEGLAMYLSNDNVNDKILSKDEKNIILKALKNDNLPNIDFLEVGTNSWSCKKNLSFIFTISMIETIINIFGKSMILKILINPNSDIFKTMKISKNKFERSWHKFLKEKYKNKF